MCGPMARMNYIQLTRLINRATVRVSGKALLGSVEYCHVFNQEGMVFRSGKAQGNDDTARRDTFAWPLNAQEYLQNFSLLRNC